MADFFSVTIDALRLRDASDYRRAGVELVFELLEILRRDRVRFLVPRRRLSWDRATALNLVFWTPGGGALLPSREVAVDELVHAAWHHLARRRLGARSMDAILFGEALASASDIYLLGRLLRRAPNAAFLLEEGPRLAERAAAAGLSARGFERLLFRVATEPEASFESLRQLLFDASRALGSAASLADAAARLARFDRHPFAPLLHHYELPTWVLFARAYGSRRASARVASLDAALRRSPAPLGELLFRLGVAASLRVPHGRASRASA